MDGWKRGVFPHRVKIFINLSKNLDFIHPSKRGCVCVSVRAVNVWRQPFRSLLALCRWSNLDNSIANESSGVVKNGYSTYSETQNYTANLRWTLQFTRFLEILFKKPVSFISCFIIRHLDATYSLSVTLVSELHPNLKRRQCPLRLEFWVPPYPASHRSTLGVNCPRVPPSFSQKRINKWTPMLSCNHSRFTEIAWNHCTALRNSKCGVPPQSGRQKWWHKRGVIHRLARNV